MKGILLVGMALLLPACGIADSPGVMGGAPAPVPNPAFTDPGIETFPDEGATHVPVGTTVVYGTDPPTSGNHYPDPQEGGYFDFPIAEGYLVHSLEHGGVVLYYNPATVTVGQKVRLNQLAQAHLGIYSQVVCVPRNDPAYPVILTAWTHRLRLATYEQDRIDGFVTLFLDEGPEHAPSAP